ncbi:SH3-domain-containing protein [Phellopilus nigrolimitatus]|nr:SH3-domain-containing protein [Phellopilus nigrolimitatus]
MSYVEHIVEQIQHNVNFLVQHGHMTQHDADLIFSRLPSENSQLASVPPPPATSLSSISTGARRGVPPPPPTITATTQARAIWAYNESGQDPDDLSFRVGDVIELVAETNADWWTGKFNGRQGLFPSNHVEKIVAPAPAPVRTVLSPPPDYGQVSALPREKATYRPFGAAHHGADRPPPPGTRQVNSLGLQEAEGQDKKKSKYGKLGNTMANSAAGGVGFGAGAAIGGGLVRAIF